ncbi:MAG: CoA ester lyase [Gammaproteobacteria bacterium]|nr:CoA ester lyase [Gammaproteobacteria bacterium]
MNDRLRRSAHFIPGANDRMLQKALTTAADSLILDLEDAVTPERKQVTRDAVASWLRDVDFGKQERTVRMNPLDTPWGLADLEVTMEHPPDAYVVPKVSTLDELQTIDATLTALEAKFDHPPGEVGLILVSTETPLGVLNLPTFTQCKRVIALSWGAEDLSAALGAPRNRFDDNTFLDPYRYCRTQTLLCAAAGGVQPLDTVFVDINDEQGLKREAEEAAWMGYTGKITIHPSQIDVVNAAFTPTDAEIDESERLIAAFAEARADGRMAIRFEGKMVDVPHLTRAQKLVARAEKIRNKT